MARRTPGRELIEVVSWRKSSRSGSGANGANCVEVGAWRKSTRSGSGGSGNNCVEVGAWHKSTRSGSGGNGDNCVEAGSCSCHGIAIRDSKLPTTGDYPTLTLAHPDWTALLAAVKTGPLT